MAALWWAVILSGLYHGLNPGMGWPLGVSAALMDGKRVMALFKAMMAIAIGHFISMFLMLLPFSIMVSLYVWQTQIQLFAAALLISVGVYLFISNRHPKILARIHPAKLSLWSFVAATAHGAGLMLIPIFLGICNVRAGENGHAAAQSLMGQNVINALLVSAAHSLAMVLAGGAVALIIYLWLGLKFLSKTWFNLDRVWAGSLVVVGVLAGLEAIYQPV